MRRATGRTPDGREELADLLVEAERGRRLVEESRELVIVLDADRRVVAASRRARESLEGIEEGALLPDELLGTPAPEADAAPAPATVDAPAPAVSGSDLFAARDAFERACIERALEESGGNRTHAAKALGISVRSLQQKMGRHGVK